MTRAQYLHAREQILLAYERGRMTHAEAQRHLYTLDRSERPLLTLRSARVA